MIARLSGGYTTNGRLETYSEVLKYQGIEIYSFENHIRTLIMNIYSVEFLTMNCIQLISSTTPYQLVKLTDSRKYIAPV